MKLDQRRSLKVFLVMSSLVAISLSANAKDLAKVNQAVITEKDLLIAGPGLNQAQKESFLREPNVRQEMLSALIDREVLIQEAEKLKLDQETEFKDALNAYRKQLLTQSLLEKKIAPDLTSKAVKKYYETHPDQFNTDQVHVYHIVVRSEEEAKKVLTLAKDPKNDFMSLAEKMSADPTAKNNRGDLGYVTRDRFDAGFTQAAFSAEKGTVVGPVRTLYGFHVIKVVDKKIGKLIKFDDAEPLVREALRIQLTKTYVEDLKRNSKIEKLE